MANAGAASRRGDGRRQASAPFNACRVVPLRPVPRNMKYVRFEQGRSGLNYPQTIFGRFSCLSSATDGLAAGGLEASQAREDVYLVPRHAWLAGCKPILPPLRRLTLMAALERVGRETYLVSMSAPRSGVPLGRGASISPSMDSASW